MSGVVIQADADHDGRLSLDEFEELGELLHQVGDSHSVLIVCYNTALHSTVVLHQEGDSQTVLVVIV